MDKLVPDTLLDIFKNNDTSSPIYIQAHQAKSLADGANRIRMMVNDGKWYLNAVFKPNDLQQQVENFQKYSVLYVTNYSVSNVNGKYFILLNKCEIIGAPKKNENSNFQNLDHYLKENPGLNLFQQKLDSLSADNGNGASQPHQQIKHQASLTPEPASTTNSVSSNKQDSNIPSKFKAFTTIDQLSPYNSQWSIKVRVSYKSDLKTWDKNGNKGKLFSVHLMDETGEIRATAFNDSVDKFYDLLQENGIYYITHASIRQAKKQFSTLTNDYELFFDRNTMIESANDDSGVPQVQFNFIKLDGIQAMENNTIVDVLGIIKNVDEKHEIISKSTGKPYDRRDITIVDQSQLAINVGLWNKMARDFNLDVGTPIAIKGCKINDFNGKQLSLIPSAIVLPNPDIPEAYKLKGWYDNEGASESYKNLRTNNSNNSNLNSVENILQRISVLEAHESKMGFNEKPDYFTIKASISFIKPDNFSYPACSTDGCSKKVIEQSDGTWRCERCSINHTEPLHRYILTASAVDETGQIWLNLFNEQGEELLGCDAKTLLQMKDSNNENTLKNYLSEKVLFKEFSFRIRARLDSYQGVDRARFQVLSLSEINPSTECDALIGMLDKLEV